MHNKLINNPLYIWLSHRSYDLCTLLSPAWNSRRRFFKVYGRSLNLEHPVWWSEKLMALKLRDYNHNPLIRRCANKYRVRAYVEQCGLSELLIPCLGLWDRAEDVPFDALPAQFVLKSTMGCGNHVFCRDKSALDTDAAKRALTRVLHARYDLAYAELQYAPGPDMRPQIIGEAFVDNRDGKMLADYKFFCFHGEPRFVLYCFARGADGHASYMFMDMDWVAHPEYHPCNALDDPPARPACFDEMIACTRVLAKPFPFVRVDLYEHGGKPLFGELTFTPSACLDAEVTEAGQLAMGALL